MLDRLIGRRAGAGALEQQA